MTPRQEGIHRPPRPSSAGKMRAGRRPHKERAPHPPGLEVKHVSSQGSDVMWPSSLDCVAELVVSGQQDKDVTTGTEAAVSDCKLFILLDA